MSAIKREVVIGECRLLLGDCLEILPELGRFDACVTDPPYGARRPSARRLEGERFEEITGNDSVDSRWLPIAASLLRQSGAFYLATVWDVLELWRSAMEQCGLRVRNCLVWDKGVHGLADLQTCWAPQHEFFLFAAKGRHVLNLPRPIDILRFQRVNSADLLHPYEKPVSLIEAMIRPSTRSGDHVADPYCGSGTTGVACVRLDRKFTGIEIDERYFEIACERIRREYAQPKLFAAPEPQPEQVPMFGGAE